MFFHIFLFIKVCMTNNSKKCMKYSYMSLKTPKLSNAFIPPIKTLSSF